MGWLKRAVKWLLVLLLVLAVASWRFGLQHWLAVHTGSVNTSSSPPNYNFWSGSGSDLSEITLLGIAAGWWHKVNCHQEGCIRIGKHTVDGTPWCSRHHQDARDRQDQEQPGAETPRRGPTTNRA